MTIPRTVNKKVKIFFAVLYVVAFFFALINMGKIHILPLQEEIDLTGRVSSYHCTDKWLGVLSARKLYIATPDGAVQNIVSLSGEKIFNYEDYHVAIDGDSFFVYGTDVHRGTAFFAAERLARINADGRLEGYIFEREFARDERVIYVTEMDMMAYDGQVYFIDNVDNDVMLYRMSAKAGNPDQKPETVAKLKMPMEVAEGFIGLNTGKLYLQLISGEVYIYDLQQSRLQKLEGVNRLPPEGSLDKTGAEHLSVSRSYYWRANLYYLSLGILALGVLYLLLCFLRSSAFADYKRVWLVALFLVIAVTTLSEQFLLSKREGTISRLAAVADVTMLTLEKGFKSTSNDFKDFKEYLDRPGTREKIDWSSAYLDEVCRQQGISMPLYLMAYAVNKDNETFVLVSTDHDCYIGEKEGNLSDNIRNGVVQLGSRGRSYEFADDTGYLHVEDRYVYDAAGNLVFILEVGGDSEAIHADSVSQAVTVLLHLAAMMACWWVFFDRLGHYKDDIVSYLQAAERRSTSSRLHLAGIYFFIINLLLHMDYVLLVMVTADICGNLSMMEMAVMLGIPFMGYRIGTFGGSVITSTFIRFFGERKSGYIGAVMTGAAFYILAYACVIKNIYLLALGKLLEGVFLESVLFSLAEVMPYEIEDEDEKTRQIACLKDSGSGAVIIGLMVGGMIAEYFSYQAMYLFGIVSAVVLFFLTPLLLRSPQEVLEADDKADDKAEEVAGNAWLAFLKPEVIGYLVAVVLVFALLAGYEDFIFPIFAEASDISDIELSDMGVIANTAAFIGIETFLPANNLRPLTLMAGAFCACGLSLGLLLLNQSLFCAFVVLLLVNLIVRTVENYKELELTKITDKYGFDNKDVQENYYAVEDGIKTLQAPVLGSLCAISVNVCCAVLALLCICMPGAYTWLRGRKIKPMIKE